MRHNTNAYLNRIADRLPPSPPPLNPGTPVEPHPHWWRCMWRPFPWRILSESAEPLPLGYVRCHYCGEVRWFPELLRPKDCALCCARCAALLCTGPAGELASLRHECLLLASRIMRTYHSPTPEPAQTIASEYAESMDRLRQQLEEEKT